MPDVSLARQRRIDLVRRVNIEACELLRGPLDEIREQHEVAVERLPGVEIRGRVDREIFIGDERHGRLLTERQTTACFFHQLAGIAGCLFGGLGRAIGGRAGAELPHGSHRRKGAA